MNTEIITAYYEKSFSQWVKRIARRVPGVMDAEDVVQEAFVRALKYNHTFNPDIAKLETWFTNIVNNVHRQMKRHDFLSSEIKEDDWYTKEADEYEDDEFTCSKIQYHIGEEKREHHRNVLYTHFIIGCKVGEVARQQDMPVESVKTVIKRFKARMGELYVQTN